MPGKKWAPVVMELSGAEAEAEPLPSADFVPRVAAASRRREAPKDELGVRLALRVHDALELAEDVHAGQHLREA